LIKHFNDEVDVAMKTGLLKHRAGSSDRVLDSHHLPRGREIWLFSPILEFLRGWFRDEPCACQTLLFIHGSEQAAHQDTVHLTPYPAGYMCGVWIALENVRSDSGELFVYPGSHLAPRIYTRDIGLAKTTEDYSAYTIFEKRIRELVEEGKFDKVIYRPKAGQILVWHENLVHGGCPRVDRNLSRRSIVSHYYARGSVAYYDSRGEAASLERVL
jgi:ectoine hydroxylase-related dioxygenase (phytanoyl-CoA dioxygenase family)